jgi:hypothetical protein
MAEQGEKERRWHNAGTERRPAWGLFDMYPNDRRYPASLSWVPGERPPAKAGRVEAEPEQPETPEASNKAAAPGRPVRAPRKQTRGKADQS